LGVKGKGYDEAGGDSNDSRERAHRKEALPS
jgi:hypothetical protein